MEFQSPLHKKLHDGVFVFTAETTPPDASNKETLLKKILYLDSSTDLPAEYQNLISFTDT